MAVVAHALHAVVQIVVRVCAHLAGYIAGVCLDSSRRGQPGLGRKPHSSFCSSLNLQTAVDVQLESSSSRSGMLFVFQGPDLRTGCCPHTEERLRR